MFSKKLSILITTAAVTAMTASMSVTTFAAGWQQDAKGKWYQEDDGSYPVNIGKWIDDDGDGAYQFYFFDENGYLLTNTTPPNAVSTQLPYKEINEYGQLVSFGHVVSTSIKDNFVRGTGIDLNFADETYNEYGINRTAVEMLLNSREQNTVYGEVSDQNGMVTYSNGFVVKYPQDLTLKGITVDTTKGTMANKLFFKFYFDSHYPNDRVTDTEEKEIFLRELQLPLSGSVCNNTVDHVAWEMVVGDKELKAYWFCNDTMIMYISDIIRPDQYKYDIPDDLSAGEYSTLK
jgi:hypothetical protein